MAPLIIPRYIEWTTQFRVRISTINSIRRVPQQTHLNGLRSSNGQPSCDVQEDNSNDNYLCPPRKEMKTRTNIAILTLFLLIIIQDMVQDLRDSWGTGRQSNKDLVSFFGLSHQKVEYSWVHGFLSFHYYLYLLFSFGHELWINSFHPHPHSHLMDPL